MAKPSWISGEDNVWLSEPPSIRENVDVMPAFLVYSTYNNGSVWWTGWKTYNRLWTALRYGMSLGKHSSHQNYVRNLKTNEIVWRSWEDENPYRGRV